MLKQRLDLVGYESGKLTVTAFAGLDARRNSRWVCRCVCGNTVTHTGTNLKRQTLKSCGCEQHAKRVERLVEDYPDFHVFSGMLSRCYNPKCREYPRYGGRGFTVCDRWREGGFWVFIGDMGDRPTPAHSIDRIDNSRGYSPENCRWATSREQGNNRCTNVAVEFGGETHTLAEWSRLTGIKYPTLKGRYRKGWSAGCILGRTLAGLPPLRSVAAGAGGGGR